jgi:hypothetical protein
LFDLNGAILRWLNDIEEAQFTDTHFRSLNGEGNFNWRMIFGMKYAIGEDMVKQKLNFKLRFVSTFLFFQMLLTKKKNLFDKFDTEFKIPAVLNLQVWENDSFSPDDFLGSLSINLSHFSRPAKSPEKCTTKKSEHKHDNLFAIDGSIRGWFPVHGKCGKDKAIKQTVNK